MKQRLVNWLGTAGGIIYFLLSIFMAFAPITAIGCGFFRSLLFLTIMQFFPATASIFWIWGLIVTIKGVQDVFAIAYYICFAFLFIPLYIAIVLDIVDAIRK